MISSKTFLQLVVKPCKQEVVVENSIYWGPPPLLEIILRPLNIYLFDTKR